MLMAHAMLCGSMSKNKTNPLRTPRLCLPNLPNEIFVALISSGLNLCFIYCIGGAQVIGAMACGTDVIAPVDQDCNYFHRAKQDH